MEWPTHCLLQEPVLSGFDYPHCPVIRINNLTHAPEIVSMEWGFLPDYLKTFEHVRRFRLGYKDAAGYFHPPMITLNAVGEELLYTGKIFRKAALERRCLIASSGFFEWRHITGVNKKTGTPLKAPVKYPYFIHPAKGDYFLMAAIWQPWTDTATGEHLETFSIVTTAANDLMGQIHNSKKRMPVLLDEEHAHTWLCDHPDEHTIHMLAGFSLPSRNMEAYSIAKDFRSSETPLLPYNYPELPLLDINA